MILASTLPKVHQEWIRDAIPSMTITGVCVWKGVVFTEL